MIFGLLACAPKLPAAPDEWTPPAAPRVMASSAVVAVTAEAASPHFISVDGAGSELVTFMGYGYVIEHPTEGLIVVDPGMPRASLQGFDVYPGEFMAQAIGLKWVKPLVDQLPDMGFSVDQVRHVVSTHAHADHLGGLADFPAATLWMPAVEWEFAAEDRALRSTHPSVYAGHASVKDVAFDDGPIGSFDAHEDLFGDGSVLLLPTPGHTPAHLSVLVRLPSGQSMLIAGDVAWIAENWQHPKGKSARWFLETDPAATLDSVVRLKSWSEHDPSVILLEGHEVSIQTRVPLSPERLR